jgi:hypothetical protein
MKYPGQPGYFMNCLLRPRIWPSFRASSGVGSCDVPFRYASEPTSCGMEEKTPSRPDETVGGEGVKVGLTRLPYTILINYS